MKLGRKIFILLAAAALMASLAISPGQTGVALAQAQTGTLTYNLFATDGFITLADGVVAYIYGFVGGRSDLPLTFQNSSVAPPGSPKTFVPNGIQSIPGGAPTPLPGAPIGGEVILAGNAQFPAPVIYAKTNDIVIINLKNLGVTVRSAPNDPHTIHLHGLDVDAANDGVPETSVAAVPANAAAPGAGNIVVYMFTPEYPGTYMYHCHQEASIHVQMGMYGALVVYNPGEAGAGFPDNPATAPNEAVAGGPGKPGNLHGWAYDKDVVLLLSEFDLGQHVAEQFNGTRGAYNSVNYKPQYWFVNGLSFPNTIHAGIGFNFNNWIAAHPGYDPLIIGSVNGGATGTPGEKVLLRVINMGFEAQPMHMHGFHGKIIGSDQRAWTWANDATQAGVGGNFEFGKGMEKNTLLTGSGETYEWLVDFGQQSLNASYQPGVQSRYNPLTLAPAANTATNLPAIPDPFIPPFTYLGGPVIGPVVAGGLPTQNDNPETAAILAGAGINNFTGQFFPFHNHDDYKATNNGVYPGGMFTMLVTMP